MNLPIETRAQLVDHIRESRARLRGHAEARNGYHGSPVALVKRDVLEDAIAILRYAELEIQSRGML